jgi:hypothetical protein
MLRSFARPRRGKTGQGGITELKALTQEQKDKAATKIQKLWVGSAKSCPVYGSINWIVADHLVLPMTLIPPYTGINIGGIGYPQLMLVSKECGYTLFFNAVILGVLPSSDETPDTSGITNG